MVAFEIIMDNGLFEQKHIIERMVLIETVSQDSIINQDTNEDTTTSQDSIINPVSKITETLFLDAFDTADHWYLSGDWGLCNNTYVSANNSLCDSPNGPYLNNNFASITIKQPLLLRNIEEAYLRFQAQWDLEENVDFVELSVARAGASFSVLKIYTGSQRNWAIEEIDLQAYVGDYVYLRFQIFTDETAQADGFYFDDLSVEVVRKEASALGAPVSRLLDKPTSFIETPNIHPNPFRDAFTYSYIVSEQSPIRMRIFNTIGKELQVINIENPVVGKNQIEVNTASWEAGIYFIQMEGRREILRVVKL